MLVAGLELMVWCCFLSRRAARTVSISSWCRGLLVVVGLAVAGLSLWWLGPRLALDDSILNRTKIWLAGLWLFAANPGGVGLGHSGMLASSFLLDDGIMVRTLVGSHLTLLVECGWLVGWAWGAFIVLALTGLKESPRAGLAFAGIALSACTSTVSDWAVLFDFAERGGLGWTNWVLSWGMFTFFIGCGAWLVGGRSKLRPSRLENCGVFPEPPRAGAPALVTCGVDDVDRLRIGRTFACRYREAGGPLVWRTMEGGHELGASALGLARAFFGAVASGAPCACWGEDGTWRVLERERIAPEYRSPLYTPALAELWRRAR